MCMGNWIQCIRYRIHIHIHVQCIHVLGLSSADEKPSHKSRVRIGRVTTWLLFMILPLVKTCFIVALTHPSFVRFGSDLSRWCHAIPCNAVPPDRGCLVNPMLKPVFRSAETGEAERLWERQWNSCLAIPKPSFRDSWLAQWSVLLYNVLYLLIQDWPVNKCDEVSLSLSDACCDSKPEQDHTKMS
jgi:hypothetical protein